MIDPTRGVTQQASDPFPFFPPRPDGGRRRESLPGGQPEIGAAAQPAQVPPGDPVFDVRLDGETMRLYTELRDPETDRVLLRLPAVYHGEKAGAGQRTSIEA